MTEKQAVPSDTVICSAKNVKIKKYTNGGFMKKENAFTLAEVLITLGIIGVVAAMTLPTLVQKYRNQVVETRLKKFYSAINQAVKMAEVDYGDKKIWYQDVGGLAVDSEGNPIEGSSNIDIWFQKYLAPYLKIVKTTINSEGLPMYYFADGSALSPADASESRDWAFYPGNPDKCNKKYQNAYGICKFTFEFYPASTDVKWKFLYNKGFEPVKYAWDGNRDSLYNHYLFGCAYETSSQKDARAYCGTLIQYNNWKIPEDYPFKVDY